MRITVDESRAGENPVPHAIATVEVWSSLEEAVAYFENRLRTLGKTWTVVRGEGTPIEGMMVAIDVHDPPTETNIDLFDAEAYQKAHGYSAEDSVRFMVKHGPFLEALAESDPRWGGGEKLGLRKIREPRVTWLGDLGTIEKRIRDRRVLRAVIRMGDKGVRVRAWDVLVGVSGDARPVVVCEGIKEPVEGPVGVMVESDEPWVVPYGLVHVPWTLFRKVVREGKKVLIDGSLVESRVC